MVGLYEVLSLLLGLASVVLAYKSYKGKKPPQGR